MSVTTYERILQLSSEIFCLKVWKVKICSNLTSLSSIYLFQCDQIWRNFATLAKFYTSLGNFMKVHLVFGKIVNLLWQLFVLLGIHSCIGANIERIIWPSAHTDLFLCLFLRFKAFKKFRNVVFAFTCAPN